MRKGVNFAQNAKFWHFSSYYHFKAVRASDFILGLWAQPSKPYFKLYRIKLVAWSDCSRVLFVQDDASGIEGEFDGMKFGPCESTFREMRPSVLRAAAREAEKLFD